MCRWAAYIGAPSFLSDLVTAPEHSLIVQSRQAEECKTTLNADGFGLAWYDQRPEPGLYRDTGPAWSDPNLRSLAEQLRAKIFLAHVRAATGSATSRNNCHPFTSGAWSFMHNGQVGGFDRLRKRADMLIPDALYGDRRGATDSEALFLIALGAGLRDAPALGLARAAALLEAEAQRIGARPALRMTAALSDGRSLYAVRYASDNRAPSLYYRRTKGGAGWQVTSEPLEASGHWTEVPPSTFCTFTANDVALQPFQLPKSTQAQVFEP
ncbi:MAG: class II glutamine amidotransferase [Pseudomonadota bacterium]